ncbi:hypothetical protein METHP14_880002 [Pseudomonas sp. P14-2025]
MIAARRIRDSFNRALGTLHPSLISRAWLIRYETLWDVLLSHFSEMDDPPRSRNFRVDGR